MEKTLDFKELSTQELQDFQGGWLRTVVGFVASVVFQWGYSAGQEDREKDQRGK